MKEKTRSQKVGVAVKSSVKSKKKGAPQSDKVPHATHTPQLTRLNRVSGQINGIQRMIEEGRYCNDILIQLRAATKALHSVELQVLKTHMRHCVVHAVESKELHVANEKIEELIALLDRY